MKQSVNGELSLSFTTFKGERNVGYDFLTNGAIITVEDYEFTVEQYSENLFSKTVNCVSTFYLNSKKNINGIYEGTSRFTDQIIFILNGTGWNYSFQGNLSSSVVPLENLGNENVVSALNKVLQAHKVEYIILPNKTILFSKKIGGNNDFQYRYKYNVSDVVLTQDTTNLYTSIKGIGAEGLEVKYISPNSAIFGILEAPDIKEESFTNPNEFREYLRNQISDSPQLAIQTSVSELTSRDIGETVFLIYEPLGIEMETRILSQNKKLINDSLYTAEVVFGNTLIKSSVDLLVQQKQNVDDAKADAENELDKAKKQFNSRIDQTDNNIILEVEELNKSISTIQIQSDRIDLRVTNLINNDIAQIMVRSNEIDLSVKSLERNTSSSINLLNNNINLKIDRGGAITDINLSPGNATINADRINLNGAVIVNGTISGATSIEVSTNVILGQSLRFSDFTALTTGGGNLTLEAFNTISYVGTSHIFNGTVDFRNANVVGLPTR